VRERIQKYYQRDSIVIYPAIDTTVSVEAQPEDFFLIVSRLYEHKNIHLAVKAFQKMRWPLIIIGDGPERRKLQKLADGSGMVKFLGYQTDSAILDHYARCRAFILPQEEDFGITPIEALSYGKPVLALRRGGALEYIQEGVNGEFFDDPTEEVLADGIRRMQQSLDRYDRGLIMQTAAKFSKASFESRVRLFLGTLSPERTNDPHSDFVVPTKMPPTESLPHMRS
jgi:glycosyltransferase involved in cell wall biosynthesis